MPQRNTQVDIADTPMWSTKLVSAVVSVCIASAFSVGVTYSVLSMRSDHADASITKLENRADHTESDRFEKWGVVSSRLSVLESESKEHGEDLKEIKQLLRESRR